MSFVFVQKLMKNFSSDFKLRFLILLPEKILPFYWLKAAAFWFNVK